MRLATWNVNSLRVRMPQLLAWLERHPLDLIALQELKLTDDEFPLAELAAAGWHALYNGQKTYNGVAILSRGSTPTHVVRDIPGFDDVERRVLAATYGDLRAIAVYVPNGPVLPLPTGLTCDRCENVLSGNPLVKTTTDTAGKFTLAGSVPSPSVSVWS